ncbi:hypothetical protein [Verticiella sediminum]|nr:hypothetical protein [Verticiella sediminum]
MSSTARYLLFIAAAAILSVVAAAPALSAADFSGDPSFTLPFERN